MRQDGFTLLEILIVMVLIAILTAAAVSTINFVIKDADAKTEAQRIAALATLAAEEALLTGREYGMRIEPDSIEFFLFDDTARQWLPLTGDTTFRPRPVPEELRVELVLEGQEILLGGATAPGDATAERGDDDDEEPPPQPQLIFLSSGEITPFTLTVTETDADGETWTVEGDLLGRMEVASATP